MKTLIIVTVIMMILVAGCVGNNASGDDPGGGSEEQVEKWEALAAELEERGVEDYDHDITAALMAEEEVKFGYARDEGDLVGVYMTLYPGTGDEAVDRLNDLAWDLVESNYPGRALSVEIFVEPDF